MADEDNANQEKWKLAVTEWHLDRAKLLARQNHQENATKHWRETATFVLAEIEKEKLMTNTPVTIQLRYVQKKTVK
jgi:GH15 family glucan-1,4-alpha-glucosidase